MHPHAVTSNPYPIKDLSKVDSNGFSNRIQGIPKEKPSGKLKAGSAQLVEVFIIAKRERLDKG
jgi:hypothetical protein